MVSPVAVTAVVVLLVLALVGMALGWRRRTRAQRALALPPVPADPGATRLTVSGLHVATTFAGRPLDRVVAGGLGFRAAATLSVTETGVLVERAGDAPFLVPADGLTGAGTATWALDRGVERDGLTVLAWALTGADGEPVPVESAFRLDPADQAALLATLRPTDPFPADQEVPGADRPE